MSLCTHLCDVLQAKGLLGECNVVCELCEPILIRFNDVQPMISQNNLCCGLVTPCLGAKPKVGLRSDSKTFDPATEAKSGMSLNT